MPVRSHQWSDIQRNLGAWSIHLVSESHSRLAIEEQQDLQNELSAEEAEIDKSVITADSDDSQFRKCLFNRISERGIETAVQIA